MNKLSVIIPAYNAEKFICDGLDSITSQKTQLDYEIIIVNDGSRDGTQAVCERYIEAHPEATIKLIRQENAGVSVARNRGIAEATGDWITFVDADDCLLPGALCKLETLERLSADVILGEYSRDCASAADAEKKACELDPILLMRCALRFPKYCMAFRGKYQMDPYLNWTCWAKLYRRSFLLQHGITFPEGVFTSEDFVFLLRIYAKQPRVIGTNIKLYHYRINKQSVTHSFNAQLFENYLLVFDCIDASIPDVQYAEDVSAYVAARMVECERQYLRHNLIFTEKIKRLCHSNHGKKLIQSPLFRIFYGKRKRLMSTCCLFRIKHRCRKMINENTAC